MNIEVEIERLKNENERLLAQIQMLESALRTCYNASSGPLNLVDSQRQPK